MKIIQKPRSDKHEIIGKFLDLKSVIWPKEIKISTNLLKKYPIEFFRFCPNPFKDETKKLPSLAWFLTENGKNFLNNQYFEYKKSITNLIEEKPKVILQDNKIGEDVQIIKKPKTLKEFLNLYGKENSRNN